MSSPLRKDTCGVQIEVIILELLFIPEDEAGARPVDEGEEEESVG